MYIVPALASLPGRHGTYISVDLEMVVAFKTNNEINMYVHSWYLVALSGGLA
jgi:hypothetical protein